MAQKTTTDDATDELIAADLEAGDTLRDTEGHGETNPYGPDLTDEIVVKKRWGNTKHDRWDHDSWLMAPRVENGRVASKGFAVSFDEIDERLASGRYETADCEVHRHLDADALPVDPDADVYVRFGDIPEGGRSHNHADDRSEAGVSVYEAAVESVPADADEPGMFVPFGPKSLQIIMLAQRDTYLVTGEEVGRGNDGEPLLGDIAVVCELAKPKGLSGWVPATGN